MAAPSVGSIARNVLVVVLYLAVVAVLLFFGLTRTQMGRDGLRVEIERQFNERFDGRLEIGKLEGNLVNTFYASDVRLFDPEGRPVLTADSLVARPRWRALLSREISVRSLDLWHPRLQLVRTADGTWNLREALRSAGDSSYTEAGAPFAFTSTRLRIHGGSVATQHGGEAPSLAERGWLFNYAQARAENVTARAALRWARDSLSLNLSSFSAELPEQETRLEALSGHLSLSDRALALSDVQLETETTQLAFSAGANDLDATPTIEVDLASSRLDNDALRRLVPRWPLADAMTLSAQLHGPASDLTVDRLELEHGASRLEATGTLRGLPETLSFEGTLSDSRLVADDAQALLPVADLSDFEKLGPVSLDLWAEGTTALRDGSAALPLQLRAQVNARSEAAGSVIGAVALDRSGHQGPHYTAQLRTEALDLSVLPTLSDLPSRLSGTIDLDARGTAPEQLSGAMRLRLDESVLAGRSLTALDARLQADSGRVSSAFAILQGEATVQGKGALDLRFDRPAYQLTATTRQLDLGPLLREETLSTALNTRIELEGAGSTWADLGGTLTLAFDSSTVRRRGIEHAVQPHRSTLALAPRGRSGPRLSLTGDVATLTLEGDVRFPTLASLGTQWSRVLASAAHNALDKPYTPRPRILPDTAAVSLASDRADEPPHMQAPDTPFHVRADFRLKRADLLRAFFPALSSLETSLSGQLSLSADRDQLTIGGTLASDTLRLGRLRADVLHTAFHLRSALETPLLETLHTQTSVHAEALQIGPRIRFQSPELTLLFEQQAGTLQLNTASNGTTGPLRLSAGLELLPDRARLILREVYLAAGNYIWENPSPSVVDLYSDAVDVPGLLLASATPDTSHVQRMRLHGTLSSAARDTVFAEASDVVLRPLTELVTMNKPIGGRLNGRLALTGGLRAPELTGDITVRRLSFDDRLLGHLEASSRYVPGTPDVALEATLAPSPPEDSLGVDPFGTELRHEPSRLSLSGSFRLPGLIDRNEPGAFDLALDVDRADTFFFEYIFDDIIANVEGYLTGTGAIEGSFQRPLFSADMRVVDGYFEVPRFGLNYALEGPVQVDRRGFWLDGVQLADPTDGTATVNGSILFNDYDYFSFDLSAQLNEIQIIDVESSRDLPFYGSIWASGPATLSGPLYRATLRSPEVRTTPKSELFIPISEDEGATDTGYIIFADSTGRLPDLKKVTQRRNVLADRPVGERSFTDGLEMDLNILAAPGSTVHLVFDPLLGDVINAVGSGRIQLLRQEGTFSTYGTFEVTSGDYLFTAGQVFIRRFQIDEGTLTWDGAPGNAQLDLTASYRTRASLAGLPVAGAAGRRRLPLTVRLLITERVQQPQVDLSLVIDRDERTFSDDYTNVAALEAILNQPDQETEYATSVLLTNTFLLTTESFTGRNPDPGGENRELATTGSRLAFNSVSQLVASQLNRYLGAALPNIDINLGVQGEDPQDLDVIYGVALHLLDERLIIRGEGLWSEQRAQENERYGLEGEFVVEVRLSSSVSAEAFFRREGSALADQAITNTTGAGLSYQTQFPTWRRFLHRLFGWLWPTEEDDEPPPAEPVAATDPDEK